MAKTQRWLKDFPLVVNIQPHIMVYYQPVNTNICPSHDL